MTATSDVPNRGERKSDGRMAVAKERTWVRVCAAGAESRLICCLLAQKMEEHREDRAIVCYRVAVGWSERVAGFEMDAGPQTRVDRRLRVNAAYR